MSKKKKNPSQINLFIDLIKIFLKIYLMFNKFQIIKK